VVEGGILEVEGTRKNITEMRVERAIG